jgi:ATP-dependent helicase/nuclease subunit A
LNHDGIAQFWASDVGRRFIGELPHLHRELPFTARFATNELRDLGLAAEALPPDEYVVVQGVADIVVILPEEIWLLDFKTDEVIREALADKVKFYEPQLNAYSAALGRIYRRKVTRRWLHFLAPGATVEV